MTSILLSGQSTRFLSERRHRVTAALVSIVISLLLHLLFYFGEAIPVQFPNKAARKLITKFPVVLSPAKNDVSERAASRPQRFSPRRPETKVNMAAEAEKFRRVLRDYIEAPPPPRDPVAGAGEMTAVADIPPAPEWQPRQEVLKIEKMLAADTVSSPPRRFIPAVERMGHAPDITLPVDRTKIKSAQTPARKPGTVDFGNDAGTSDVVSGGTDGALPGPSEVVAVVTRPIVPEEKPEQITRLKRIENLLNLDVQVYTQANDGFGYLRANIKRTKAELLPPMPKDIMFVQDCSASMTEQRLYFCREALIQNLDTIGSDDRFNIVYFRDRAVKCFDDWSPRTPKSIAKAKAFIEGMTAVGETDILASMEELLKAKRDPKRPVIANVVTDGQPTVGVTDSTEIIERFSKLNGGGVSVFTMGTVRTANAYLLDLLAYRNRGDSFVVARGRWDIPDTIRSRLNEVSRPVMAGMRYMVSSETPCEVYPALTSNFYLDRPLVLYGRYALERQKVVLQIVGAGRDTGGDMIFTIDLTRAAAGAEDIRTKWGWQKVYHLIGEYTHSRDPKLLKKIHETGDFYGIQVPYRLESR